MKCKLLQCNNCRYNMLNHRETHKNYKNLMSMLIHNGIFLGFIAWEKKQRWEKEWYQERKRAYEALKLCSLLFGFNDFKQEFIGP
jgi:hypothetical protein